MCGCEEREGREERRKTRERERGREREKKIPHNPILILRRPFFMNGEYIRGSGVMDVGKKTGEQVGAYFRFT